MFDVGICLASIEAEFSALGVHVRFAKREWINIRLVLEVCQGVVDKPVCALVRTDSIYHVEHGCIGFETPVVFRDLWGGMVGPLWEATFFDVLNTFLELKTSGERDHRRL